MDEDEGKIPTPPNSNSKAMLITVALFILFLALIGFLVFSKSSTNNTADVQKTPTPTTQVFDQTTGEPTIVATETGVLVSPTPTTTLVATKTPTPTKTVTPTTQGPGNLQNPPTNTPRPTSFPLSPN